jgi:hypothetical protein
VLCGGQSYSRAEWEESIQRCIKTCLALCPAEQASLLRVFLDKTLK